MKDKNVQKNFVMKLEQVRNLIKIQFPNFDMQNLNKIMRADEKRIKEKIRYALDYVGNPKKFLYGSDWPLISMTSYIKLMKKIIPSKLHKDIFYNNALKLFNLK